MSYIKIPNIADNIKLDNFNINLCSKKPKVKISYSLYYFLNLVKGQLEELNDEWNEYKLLTNPLQFIYSKILYKKYCISKLKPISKSFYKLIEIQHTFDLFHDFFNQPIQSFHLAEGPGGFIEAMCYLRNNKEDNYYGITLMEHKKNMPRWNIQKLLLNNKNIKILEGLDKTGNLFHTDNFLDIVYRYRNKMNLITADGGFDFSTDYENQEINMIPLILTEILYAINIQKTGGHFILKIFDIFHSPTIQMIYFLKLFYEEVYIYKPDVSSIGNSEKYIVCKSFKFLTTDSKITNKCFEILVQLNKFFELNNSQSNDGKNNDVENDRISKKFIKNIYMFEPNNLFLDTINQFNMIIGQRQMENIQKTIDLIKTKDKMKIDKYKKNNIEKCLKWCSRHNIPINLIFTPLKI